MKTIKLNEKEIKIATTVDDLTLPKLVDYINLSSKNNDEIDLLINLLNIATNLSIEEIEDLDIEDFKMIGNQIELNDALTAPFQKSIIVDGIEYFSKADIEHDTFKFTIGETKILKELISKYKIEYIYYLASLIFLKEGERANLELIESRKDLFTDIKLSVLVPYMLYLNKVIQNEGSI